MIAQTNDGRMPAARDVVRLLSFDSHRFLDRNALHQNALEVHKDEEIVAVVHGDLNERVRAAGRDGLVQCFRGGGLLEGYSKDIDSPRGSAPAWSRRLSHPSE